MKIKFSLQRPAGAIDLLATVEATATVGDLAAHLLLADPERRATPKPLDNPTLTIVSGPTLDVRQPIVDSALTSGVTVSISEAGDRFGDVSQPPAAVVRVVAGPDNGREFAIPSGSAIVGRERGVDVRLSDPMASRRHARINVAESIEIIDLGSANGVQIDDVAVPRAVLRPGDVVQIGDTKLSVHATAPSRPRSVEQTAAVGFVRSPRLDPVFEGRIFEAPDLPEREKSQRFPVIALLAPIMMGAVIYAITRSLASLVFVGLTPVMLVGSAVEARLGGRAAFARALAAFREDVAVLVQDAESAAAVERDIRNDETPSMADCLTAVRHRSSLMWTRRPAERAFGEARIGTGRLPSRSRIEMPSAKRGPRKVLHELRDAVAKFTDVDDVPLGCDLTQSALGIAGPRTHSLPVARAVVGQLAALHSPADLTITVLASSNSAEGWAWAKWLPHTSSPQSPITGRHLASTGGAADAVVSELHDLITTRTSEDARGQVHTPSVLVVVEGDAPVDHSRLVTLVEAGAPAGIFLVWRADELTQLPSGCKTFVNLARDGVTAYAGYQDTATEVAPVRVETLSESDAFDLARRLSPVIDIGAAVVDASDLPRAVPLLNLTGSELASSESAVIERWTENRSILTGPLAPSVPSRQAGSLRAVLGQSATEIHALDLRTDGPHALVGGTTGAGKSELLQSWILALAAAHSPQRLTFLLVDYKGGSAFRDCVDLPHTVGLVTDLTPPLVRRALTSLKAELRYREHVLAAHSAKDLMSLERMGVADTPPSLVIVVDEFAALVNEVPEFVDGVVDVAARGRSLGLHLILATQRPAGVIKENLRANTNLRIALRMADETDSSDVLGSTEAAFFDPGIPGRAVSKTGPGRLVPFQTGYAGGWTSDEPVAPDISVEELGLGVGATWSTPDTGDSVHSDPGPTDIRRIVNSIRAANTHASLAPPRRPWLPQLRHVYDLSARDQVPTSRRDTSLVFGVRDDPDNQSQPTVAFEPDRDGNLAVFGTGGSGKSTVLRTLAIAAGFTFHGGPCHVYGIDFGARGLAILDDLPHVGSVVSGADHERITRLLSWLRGLIDERALRYSKVNAATITDYRSAASAPDEPRILLLVDGVAAFRQAYETTARQRWFDMFASLATDGRPVGVHVVVSSEQRSAMPTALASAVQRRIVLRLATSDEYSLLGVPADVLTAASPPGRGLLDGDEVQVAILGDDVSMGAQAEAVRSFADAMRRSGIKDAPAIRVLPEHVSFDELPVESGGLPVIGLAGDTLAPLAFRPSGAFVISGPPGSGRSTALISIARAIRRTSPSTRLVLLSARQTESARHSIWNATAAGAADIAAAAASLVAELPSRMAGAQGSVAVFVESVAELSGGPADQALTTLLRFCDAEGLAFVAEGETGTLNGTMHLVGQVKSARAGLALAPDTSDGQQIYRTDFPARLQRAEFPPGRGLLVSLGKVTTVQVARDVSEVGAG